MKKFLSVMGVIFLCVIAILGLTLGWAAHVGGELDRSSKAYVEANVPVIVSKWSQDELLKRASPELLKMINKDPDQLTKLFQGLSRLGTVRSCDDISGDSNVLYNFGKDRVISAHYLVRETFENGKAEIEIGLLQKQGEWKISLFKVTSPLFML